MFEIIGLVLIFISGLFVGSFLNVVSDRVPNNESPIKGRSKCPHCGHTLGPKDLVPLLSFILQKGRCRYCNERISLYYPFSEILTGLAFAGLAYHIGVFVQPLPIVWFNFAYLAVLASFLIVILLADMKFQIIPNKVVIPAIVFLLVFMIGSFGLIGYSSYQQLQNDEFGRYLLEVGYWQDQMFYLAKGLGITVVSALLIAGFFKFLIWITKGRGMGGGDVKLALLVGLINGFPLNVVAIVLAFISGALFSGLLMLMKRKGIKDVIPFGPFLIFGCVVAFVFGQQIFDWYFSLI